MGWGAINPNNLTPGESLKLEHLVQICQNDCTFCEDEAYELNAQLDCPHREIITVCAGAVWHPVRSWCGDCGKDLPV